MKRILVAFGVVAVIVFSFSSCTTQRDCQGNRHTRLSNGVML